MLYLSQSKIVGHLNIAVQWPDIMHSAGQVRAKYNINKINSN